MPNAPSENSPFNDGIRNLRGPFDFIRINVVSEKVFPVGAGTLPCGFLFRRFFRREKEREVWLPGEETCHETIVRPIALALLRSAPVL